MLGSEKNSWPYYLPHLAENSMICLWKKWYAFKNGSVKLKGWSLKWLAMIIKSAGYDSSYPFSNIHFNYYFRFYSQWEIAHRTFVKKQLSHLSGYPSKSITLLTRLVTLRFKAPFDGQVEKITFFALGESAQSSSVLAGTLVSLFGGFLVLSFVSSGL